MELLTVKIISLIAILAVALLAGMIPLVSARLTNSERFFSLGNAFAGGLFLGVGFIHLLPEGIEMLSAYSDFPWGAVAATSGFAVLLLLDRILFPDHQLGNSSEKLYPYVLLAMLSIHSIVAGVALGIEEYITGAVALLIGIVFHKGPAAFALIVCTHLAGLDQARQKSILVLFSVMTPLGILLGLGSGYIFLTTSAAYGALQGVFNAFAAGTFIYIAVMDIIDKELTTHQKQMAQFEASAAAGEDEIPVPQQASDRLLKFGLIVFGIALVGVMTEWTHSPHDHGFERGHDEIEVALINIDEEYQHNKTL